MPFEPRLKEEILQEMVGQVVSQSDLTDLSEGSVLLTILGSVAEQLEAVEFRLRKIRDSFDLDKVSGADLDERVSELPGSNLQRIGKTPTSGDVLTITRASAAASTVLPKGSLVGRTDAPDILYTTTTDTTYGIGVTSVSNIRVSCLRYGREGNCAAKSIDKLVNVPSEFISVTQDSALATGQDRETDAELRSRAKAYLGSLATATPDALRAAALTFVSVDGVRARHANIFEDLQKPAYTEIVVDDGTGFSGFSKPGQVVSGTVPVQGALQLYHQAPATAPITSINVNGVKLEYPENNNPTWKSYPERGIVQLIDGQTDITPGDTWVIGDSKSPYNVYTGFIAELQAVIEGQASSPTINFGKRDAGVQVRVVPPTTYDIPVTVNLILKVGVIVDDAVSATKTAIEEFFIRLGPGDTLYLSDLYATLEASLSEYIEAVDVITPADNFSPVDSRTSLRAGTIEVT